MSIHTQLVHVSVLTVAALSYAAFAAGPPGFPTASAPSVAEKRLVVADAASNAELVGQAVSKWEATLTRAYGWEQEGVEQLRVRVGALPAETLKNLAGAASWQRFTELMLDAERTTAASSMAQKGFALDERDPDVAKMMQDSRKLLGDQNRDLVFIPTKPCRIFDTRFEALGSPYVGRYTGANTKNFWAFNFSGTGDFSGYGGNSSCPENVQTNASTFAGTAPYAVMIKLTIVGPAAAGSYVSAVRSGDTNPAPNLVSAYCEQGGGAPCFATVVVPVCRGTAGCAGTRDISIDSNMAMDLAGEVQGYFIRPQATALQCSETSGPAVSIGPNTYAQVAASLVCSAGFTPVSIGFANSSSDVLHADSGQNGSGYYLYVRNVSSVTQSVVPRVTCCRVPGR